MITVSNRLGCINDTLFVDYLLRRENVDFVFALNDYFFEDKNQKNVELIDHFTKKLALVFNKCGLQTKKGKFTKLENIFSNGVC